MRIGLEMFGTQSASRGRGIGRYSRNLAAGLVAHAQDAGHELVFYAEAGRPLDQIPTTPHAVLKTVSPAPTLRDSVAKIVHDNPDALDLLAFTNPLEMTPGFDIPSRPVRGLPLAAVVYDLIPLIFQDDYLRQWPAEFARRYLWALERLRTFDAILAISEATRSDVVRLLNVDPAKVVTIGTAGDDRASAFTPGRDDPADLPRLAVLGVTRPFVFSVSASDPRKNLAGLIEAFSLLPAPVRVGRQLVVTAALDDEDVRRVRDRALRLGLDDGTIVLTGRLDDAGLRALYRRAGAFVFPSLYEGFGLPIVEALACGAPVVAGDNSSQPEAAGDAALLVDARDPAAIASALARVLTDPALAQSLRDRGPAQAKRFSWSDVARRAFDAFAVIAREAPPQASRPRIAVFSPLPPDAPDLSPTLDALNRIARVDLFHDASAHPFTRFSSRSFGGFDHRLFDRLHRLRPYDALLTRPDDTSAHPFAETHPGVVFFGDPSANALALEHVRRLGKEAPPCVAS